MVEVALDLTTMLQVHPEYSTYSLPSSPNPQQPKLQNTARIAYEAAKNCFQQSMEHEVSVD